jgi:2-methylisocitrate lyase-like PEP mutase family enzyme
MTTTDHGECDDAGVTAGGPAPDTSSAYAPAMASASTPGAKAERLRALHHDGRPLILPNAWDAASARVLAEAGFAAIATGSAAVAAALGYDDHQAAPVDEMFAAARRICASVGVPVTVDVEAGYDLPAGELVERLIAAGAAGCNLEDTVHPYGRLMDMAAQADRLAAVRDAARSAGADLVLNARVDVYFEGMLPEGTGTGARLDEAVRRGHAYLAAGADCVYPILVTGEDEIATLVERVPGPVNVLYQPGAPALARLGELGVARVSFGPGLHRATLRHLERLAGRIRSGTDPY